MPVRPFNSEFQRKLLVLLLENYDFFLSDGLVKSSYFEDPVEKEICAVGLAVYRKYQLPPTWKVLWAVLKRRHPKTKLKVFKLRVRELIKTEVPAVERKYISEELRQFVGVQTLKSAMIAAVQPLEGGDLNKSRSILKIAVHAGDREPLKESSYFQDVQNRMKAEGSKEPAIRTLVGGLDAVLREHGLHAGELGVVLAVPGIGKTMFLCHISKAAVLQRRKVLYLSLDDPTEIISERLDSSFSGIDLNQLSANRNAVVRRIKKLGETYGESLIIKEMLPGSDMAAMNAYMDKLLAKNYRPDLVILDYVNLVASTDRAWKDNQYKALGSVFQDLKRLCKERSCVVWVAAQANRSGVNKDLVTSAEIAESFEGVHAGNVIISLNRTPEELRSERLRIFLVKNKTSTAQVIIPIRTNYRKGAFYRKSDS